MQSFTRLNSLLIIGLIFLASCSKDEQATPSVLEAKFEITVTGEAPNASITITNSSAAANSYTWTFSEGASISTSDEKTPAITVEKAGELEVTLNANNGSQEKTTIKTITIPGHSTVLTFEDIEFSLKGGDATYGRFFSTETGLIYKNNDVTAENGSKIDIAFDSFNGVVNFFESPDKSKYDITNASASKFTNYVTSEYDIEDFDEMASDQLFGNLDILDDEGSFPATYKGAVLFENSTGKKGVIKIKAINSNRVLVDIKIQKY